MRIKGNFVCWACHQRYIKNIDDAWLGWTCPKCGAKTSGSGSQEDEKGFVYTFQPVFSKEEF